VKARLRCGESILRNCGAGAATASPAMRFGVTNRVARGGMLDMVCVRDGEKL
jgi:hypothetical protein